MKTILAEGGRSPGWDLSGNCARAAKCGHPNIELLGTIARVISEEAPVSILDAFEEWQRL